MQNTCFDPKKANKRNRNQSKFRFLIFKGNCSNTENIRLPGDGVAVFSGNDERMSSRAETELFLDAKINNKFAEIQFKKDALDITNSEVDNHYVSVEEHKNQIKGYVALEAKSIVAVDDFKVNRTENDSTRKIIKPIKNYSFKVSGNYDGTHRLCNTANANYDK